MEMSPRGSARHKGTRWGGPRPSQPLSTMFANTRGHFLRGRRRGEDEGGSHTPRRWGWGPGGGSRFTPKPPPLRAPRGTQRGQGLPRGFCWQLGAAEPGQRGGMFPAQCPPGRG